MAVVAKHSSPGVHLLDEFTKGRREAQSLIPNFRNFKTWEAEGDYLGDWSTSASGGSTCTVQTGGYFRNAPAAGGSGYYVNYTPSALISNIATTKLYLRFKARLNVAPSAGMLHYLGMNEAATPTNSLLMPGAVGSTYGGSDTKFALAAYDSGGVGYFNKLTSTVAVDTSWHTFRLWNPDGANFHFAVDSEPVQTVVSTGTTGGAARLTQECFQAAAQADTFDVHYVQLLYEAL